MPVIDSWFFRHAYMLEFRKKEDVGSETVTDVFTFSLPPESEQINKSQRVNYTKTFGGVVVDDYGNDISKITLSGTTGNNELKTIFRGLKRAPVSLNGEDELLYLDKLIDKYGQVENLKNKCIYLYDLSKFELKSLLTSPNYWQVNIDSFKYSRDKGRPTFYKYTLEMTAYKPKRRFASLISSNFESTCNFLSNCFNVINQIFGSAALLNDAVYVSIGCVQNLVVEYKNYERLCNGLIEDSIRLFTNPESFWKKGVKSSSGDNAENNTSNNSGNTNTTDTNDTNVDLTNAVKELQDSVKKLEAIVEDMMKKLSDGQIESIVKANGLSSEDELFNQMEELLDEINTNTETLVSDVKNCKKVAYYKGVIYHGTKKQIVKSTDTYESISLENYDDPDYADYIESFNNGKELETGEEIIIPILTEDSTIQGNEVVKSIYDEDECGKDLALDENGDLNVDFSNGDLKKVAGNENIEQAIQSRLQTEMGTRIRDNSYGIKSVIGGTEAITAFLYASIHQTVLEDPRIQDIEYIKFNGNGDKLYYELGYITKLGTAEVLGGNI